MCNISRRRICTMSFLAVIAGVLFTTGIAAQEKGVSRLAAADGFRLFSDKGFSFEYRLSDSIETSVMKVYLKDTDRSVVLCVYTGPANLAGRKVFMEGNTFWMLDKKMRDPIRISSRQMLFGQASAGDITRLSFSDGYTVIGETTEGNLAVPELQAKAGKETSYPRVRFEVRASDSRPVRAYFFAATGTLMKTIYYDEYQTIGGKVLLVKFRMVNELNKEESVIELGKFEEKTLENRYFSREGMKALK